MKRSESDHCLLCEENLATKKNSHIISKFIGKPILKDGGKNKAYILNTSKPDQRPKIQQDSPKEDHILCPNCEEYFEVLETYVAEHLFKRMRSEKFKEDFEHKISEGGVEFVLCKELNSTLYRLFIISLFWRCSITTEEPFKDFSIREASQLKRILKHYRSSNKNEILNFTECTDLLEIPMVVMRSDKGLDASGNFLYANDEKQPIYQLQTNDFILAISMSQRVTLDQFQFLTNVREQEFLIGILPHKSWLKLRDHLINLAVKRTNETAERLGVKYKGIK